MWGKVNKIGNVGKVSKAGSVDKVSEIERDYYYLSS